MPRNENLDSSDVLSDILRMLRLQGEVYCMTALAPGAGLSFPKGKAHFHVIERGTCWVHVRTLPRPVEATAGDLVLLPGTVGHVLSASATQRSGTEISAAVASGFDSRRNRLRVGRGKPVARAICGGFVIDTSGGDTLLGVLPPVIHVAGQEGLPLERLELTLRFLMSEARSELPGSAFAASRLVDLVFLEAVRHWIGQQEEGAGHWLGALRDRQIGTALQKIHAKPEHPWSVRELAEEVGMSRSPFAARFVALVGEPPLKYVTRWRMKIAARLLRRGLGVRETAERVGYDSEAAFSRTFKKYLGEPPVKFRGR